MWAFCKIHPAIVKRMLSHKKPTLHSRERETGRRSISNIITRQSRRTTFPFAKRGARTDIHVRQKSWGSKVAAAALLNIIITRWCIHVGYGVNGGQIGSICMKWFFVNIKNKRLMSIFLLIWPCPCKFILRMKYIHNNSNNIRNNNTFHSGMKNVYQTNYHVSGLSLPLSNLPEKCKWEISINFYLLDR